MSFERKLIAEVKKYECIYNMQAMSYKDVAFKDKLWQRVAQQCGSNVDECKKKWKHLRDCYNRCKKRDLLQPKRPKGLEDIEGDVRRKVWRYKNQMEFLAPFFNQKIMLLNRDACDYNSSDDFDPPTPAQPTNMGEITKIEEITKIDEMYAENEMMEAESLKELELEEADTHSVEAMFPSFLEAAIPSVPNVCGIRVEDDSTTLMFKLLDRKIKQASLTEEQVSDMETSVMMFVYKKLSEFKK